MDNVLLPLLIFTAPARRRAEISERLLPAAVSGSIQQRLIFAGVLAQQQIGKREQLDLQKLREAAARFASADNLAASAPTLYAIYAALPESVGDDQVFPESQEEVRGDEAFGERVSGRTS